MGGAIIDDELLQDFLEDDGVDVCTAKFLQVSTRIKKFGDFTRLI